MGRALVLLVVVGCGADAPAGGTPGDGAAADGAVPVCPPGQWCTEPAPVASTLLAAVWAIDGDVLAVGDDGAILRRRAGAWTRMASPTAQHLRGVWAASTSDAWAVGVAGTVLHYDGTSWSPIAVTTIDLHAVFGLAADDVYLAGTGTVVHWNGSTFTAQAIAGDPSSISAIAADDVWVTGENSRVSHYTGTWTTGIDPGAGTTTYTAIHEVAAGQVWVATFVPGSETRRLEAGTWTPHAAAGAAFLGFHAVAADDLWGAGGSKVGHWDGAAWSIDSPGSAGARSEAEPRGVSIETPGGAAAQYWGIHGRGSGVWIVGSDSLILHRE